MARCVLCLSSDVSGQDEEATAHRQTFWLRIRKRSNRNIHIWCFYFGTRHFLGTEALPQIRGSLRFGKFVKRFMHCMKRVSSECPPPFSLHCVGLFNDAVNAWDYVASDDSTMQWVIWNGCGRNELWLSLSSTNPISNKYSVSSHSIHVIISRSLLVEVALGNMDNEYKEIAKS